MQLITISNSNESMASEFIHLTPEQQRRIDKQMALELCQQQTDRHLVCHLVTSQATTEDERNAQERALANG